jgi:hypothetical protein
MREHVAPPSHRLGHGQVFVVDHRLRRRHRRVVRVRRSSRLVTVCGLRLDDLVQSSGLRAIGLGRAARPVEDLPTSMT